MAFEVSVAIVIRNNESEGSLITVTETETLFVVGVPEDGSPEEKQRAVALGIFGQMELRVATMSEAVKDKTMEQVAAHTRQVKDGTHPLFSQ